MKTPAPPDDVNWAALLKSAQVVNLEAVRTMKEAHRRLLHFEGPAPIGAFVRLFPPSHRKAVEEMLNDRVDVSRWATESASEAQAYEQFMKLSGPYWFSVLFARSDRDPVLQPDHYLNYRKGPVPDWVALERVKR